MTPLLLHRTKTKKGRFSACRERWPEAEGCQQREEARDLRQTMLIAWQLGLPFSSSAGV